MKTVFVTLVLISSCCLAEDATKNADDISGAQDVSAASTAKSDVPPMTSSVGNYLNIAILSLPPKYCGGVPIANRAEFLRSISSNPQGDSLDYGNGYLHYRSENIEERTALGVNCSFCIKLLPTAGLPHVFVLGIDSPSEKNVVVLKGNKDVTDSVLPPDIERNRYIIPSRNSLDFEVRKRQIHTTDTGFQYFRAGALEAVIRWNGRKFEKVPVTEQTGTGQPATRPESKSEGDDKPQTEVNGRSR